MASGTAARVMSRVLAVLLIGALVPQWILLRMAVTNPPWTTAGFMALLFVTLTVVSVLGLLRGREWGFYGAYLLVPFGTLAHGVALVPFVTAALPTLTLRIWGTALLNLLFFLAVAGTHWALRKDRVEGRLAGRQPV